MIVTRLDSIIEGGLVFLSGSLKWFDIGSATWWIREERWSWQRGIVVTALMLLSFSPFVPSEEAVNEVKRQAMSELQKAVSDAERKAHEMISAERSKMERALAEAKRQASEDALTIINQQEDSSEVSTYHRPLQPPIFHPSLFRLLCSTLPCHLLPFTLFPLSSELSSVSSRLLLVWHWIAVSWLLYKRSSCVCS